MDVTEAMYEVDSKPYKNTKTLVSDNCISDGKIQGVVDALTEEYVKSCAGNYTIFYDC